ncbi:hypothetical protein ACKWTF_014784 [Chironomus riparius]
MNTIFKLFLTIFCLNSIKCANKNQVLTRFRSIECQADNNTAVMESCYVKAVSRRTATLNLKIKLLKIYNKPIHIQMILYYRYGNIYREVIDTKPIEWCSIMAGLTGHLFMMQTIQQIKEVAGDVIHKCPYENSIEVKNLTLDDNKALDVFPEGTYKLSWISYGNKMNIIYRFNVSVFVKSPVKESMG